MGHNAFGQRHPDLASNESPGGVLRLMFLRLTLGFLNQGQDQRICVPKITLMVLVMGTTTTVYVGLNLLTHETEVGLNR